MRPIYWDDGTRYDDPNAYWGDGDGAGNGGSYMLEPGDPGYVQTAPLPAAAPSTRSRKGNHTMNETPDNPKELLPRAKRMRTGATTLQDVIGLHHHRDTTLNLAILKYEGDPAAAPGSNANKGSQLVYKLCEDATGDAERALKLLSDGAVKTLLSGYHDVLVRIHGRKHNAGWAAAGFTQHPRVPGNHEERQTLLAAMRSYLAANPSYETNLPQADGPPLAVTAAAAQALGVTMQAAFDLIATRAADQELCKNLRDADFRALYDEVSGMTAELRGLLADDDPRWEAFGLNIPAHPNPPEAVTVLTLKSVGTGRELLDWEPAVRATYYRLFLMIHGVDAEPRFVKRDADLDHTFTDLAPGTTISAYVIAANPGGEAAPTPTGTQVVGAEEGE
ncbi:MAG: hypothetical protein JNG86_07300 [Verrucomicrobiaceae bacterium]|nr:hypothetical protein [Verrucomicrobiaceae bacterium]